MSAANDRRPAGGAAQGAGRDARTRETLTTLLGPVVEDAGLDLEDLQVSPAGRRRLVRIVVDGDDGVSLDAVAAVSQAVSAALDSTPEADAALGGSPYVLEVTSPGVDRPLTEPRHWRRATGRLVALTRSDGSAVTGRLTGTDPGAGTVTLTVEGVERVVALVDVTRARVQVEFSRAAADPDDAGGSDGDLADGADDDDVDGSEDDDDDADAEDDDSSDDGSPHHRSSHDRTED